MYTPAKTGTHIETSISKLKVENSPVFKYIDSLSPIKSIPIASQTISSLGFSSPPSVFTSPRVASHKESRFRSLNNSSTSNKDMVSIREEALTQIEPTQTLKNDCTPTTTPRVINHGSCSHGGIDLQKMCDDNVKAKCETRDWATLMSDDEPLIYVPTNDSEAFRCFFPSTSNSETRGTIPTLEPVPNSNGVNNKSESSGTPSTLHRGVGRRCLDFEMFGDNKQTLSESSSRRLIPSIGLHLNTIAMSATNSNVGNDSGNVKVGLQSSTTPALHSHDIVRENETGENSGQVVKEGPKFSALVQQLHQSSPKKKRRKSEGETSCIRCNCRKSQCLKLYCECFAAGVYCIEPCSCVNCFNKRIHEDTVLATRKQIESRNPLAFAPKVIRNSESIVEAGDDASKTPASARHKRGCSCKKSNCMKKYCECYQSGVRCSINCRCEGCKNAFGRKYESSLVGIDTENETFGKSRTVKPQQKTELCNSVPLPPSTPMPLRQPLAQLPISSNNILLPRHLHEASGSLSYKRQSFKKQDSSLLYHSRIETTTEERAEDIENQSPITNINAASPNSKRVSLPHLDSSESTTWRRNGGRKLLLSTPTFPPLTPHHQNSLNL